MDDTFVNAPRWPERDDRPTLIGVLGDTHGRAEACLTAVEQLDAIGVTHLFHTGDVGDGAGGMKVLDALAGTGCAFVWGNNDFDRDELTPYARDLGLLPLGDVGRLSVDGCRVLVAHGDDIRGLRRWSAAADSGEEPADLLLTGHSHLDHNRRHGAMRWVNPGALFRAATKTFCTIDPARLGDEDAVQHHELAR